MIKCKENSVQILQGGVCKTTKEQALKTWYVEVWFNGQKYRLSKGLNRIKTYKEKLEAFDNLKAECEEAIKDGSFIEWYEKSNTKKVVSAPIDIKPKITSYPVMVNQPTTAPVIEHKPLLLGDAVQQFIVWHKKKGSRKNTIEMYASVTGQLLSEVGNEIPVGAFTKRYMEDIYTDMCNRYNWENRTYNSNKLVLGAFFQWLLDGQHILVNPMKGIKSKYVSKSTRNQPFTDSDFKKIMVEVEKRKSLAMFVKAIYYTCIRPVELTRLKVKHIEWNRQRIYVPASISKNKKDGYVYLMDDFFEVLKSVYKGVNKEYYLFGINCDETIWGEKPTNRDNPYRCFNRILKRLDLDDRNYTLYAVKHYSNIQRYLAGWTVAEIMVGNRHSSLSETENYLRDLVDFVDIKKKSIPMIGEVA